MYELESKIEDINLTARRLAEGLFREVVELNFTNDQAIADAARFFHEMTCRHELSQSWREKTKGQRGGFDNFDNMDWGKDDDDPFRLGAAAVPGKIRNKRV